MSKFGETEVWACISKAKEFLDRENLTMYDLGCAKWWLDTAINKYHSPTDFQFRKIEVLMNQVETATRDTYRFNQLTNTV